MIDIPTQSGCLNHSSDGGNRLTYPKVPIVAMIQCGECFSKDIFELHNFLTRILQGMVERFFFRPFYYEPVCYKILQALVHQI